MHFTLHPLLLLTLFSIPHRAFTTTYCHGLAQILFPTLPSPPPLMDCFFISSHLPSHPDYLNKYLDPSRRRSHDSPFFPQALFRHGKCLARVTYYAGLHPPGDRGPALDFLHQPQLYTPSVPLSERSLFSMWATIRAGIESITDECLVHDTTGVAWDSVDISEIAGAWISVEVSGTGSGQTWVDETRMGQMGALGVMPRVGSVNPGHWIRNKFKGSYYDVP